MTDIVERLRNRNNPENRWVMMTEAAAEIERLRAALQVAADHLASEGYTIEADMARRTLEPKP
jgi:hypothetical protein